MMNKIIKKGDSSFVMETEFADRWQSDATVTVNITDKKNTTKLVTSGATTIYTADTVSGTANKGARSFALATGNALTQGQKIKVGTDANGFHTYEVDGYASGTKMVTITRGLKEALVGSEAVRGLNISYTLDASGASWTGVKSVWVQWVPSGDDMPFTEDWRVLSSRSDIAGLEALFQDSYEQEYNHVKDDDRYLKVEGRAREIIELIFSADNRDLDKLVDGTEITELLMVEMALLIGTEYDMSETKYNRLKSRKTDLVTYLRSEHLWIDDNQDGIETDSETQPASSVIFTHRKLGF
jgi:hypothetical protein